MFFSIQNLTRRTFFNSKSDAFYFLNLKSDTFYFLIQNLPFKSSSQILAELLSKCYQHQRTACWKVTTAWSEKLFYECVVCVCLTFGTTFFLTAFFMAFGFLMGVMTISFALAIDLYKSLWNSENGLFTKILF